MRQFPKYSNTSVLLCDSESEGPCALALARSKTAVIRVGGGELFDDLYRAVIDWNKEHGKKSGHRYEVIGGGAGTVSAVGGWLQGGGLSTGLERLWGVGVDQVLEIEMVLPDATHVKFGPSAWQTREGFLYPQTTEVTGKCNKNVVEDESKWDWQDCTKSISFEDLWFAVRGGGGGTYGIVTAVHYQLHELWDSKVVGINFNQTMALLYAWDEKSADYLVWTLKYEI